MGRWDDIEERLRKHELRDYVLDQVAQQLVAELSAFPPRIEEWLDAALEARYRAVLARPSPPDLEVFRVACELAREELLREYELIDRFCRSPEFRRLVPDALDEQTVHFTTRYLVDSALAFQDLTKGKFKRAELVALIEKVEDKLLRGHRLRL